MLCLPTPALANGGTPLMWAGAHHLVFGNAVIGLIEGLIIAWMFGRPKMRCIVFMVLANYVSSWLGYLLLTGPLARTLPLDIYSLRWWIWILLVATFLFTLVVEWPFVALCLRGVQGWFRKSLRGDLGPNAVTYLLMAAWLGLNSSATLYTRAQVVPVSQISLPANVTVYYIDEADGDVYRMELPSGESRRVHDLGSHGADDRLCVDPSWEQPGQWNLMAWQEVPGQRNGRMTSIEPAFSAHTTPQVSWLGNPGWQQSECEADYRGTRSTMSKAARLVPSELGKWGFHAGFFAEGLTVPGRHDGSWVHLGVETPLVTWPARNVTHLPGDYAIFQLGRNQICVFEMRTWKVALLAYGRGPVVVLTDAPPAASQPAEPVLDQTRATEIAQQAVARHDAWGDGATYEVKPVEDGWWVIARRQAQSRLIVIDNSGHVLAYARGS